MNHLRTSIYAGLILLFLAGVALTVFILVERESKSGTRLVDNFSFILRQYDEAALYFSGTEMEVNSLQRQLDNLESRAVTVEAWLSVLKRRRALAAVHPPSFVNYHNSIDNALTIYPHSQPLMAIAAAALVKDASINKEAEEQLRDWLAAMTFSNLNSLRIALHVLLGDFRSPLRASALGANLHTDGSQPITVNMAILQILQGDYRGAASNIQILLNAPSPTAHSLRFAAEYHYDFGELLRSAQIFSVLYSFLNDEYSLTRQADALYLAEYTETAMTIWTILAGMRNVTGLYNLAVTTKDPTQAAIYLEQLIEIDTDSKTGLFGLIRYSRFLDYTQAISLLRTTANMSPYIDLEMVKRQWQGLGIGRQLADAWLLLDRHGENEELYKWVCWLFFFQRQFEEARILLDRMEMLAFSHEWVEAYRAVLSMLDGDLDRAEDTLRSIPHPQAWYVHANIGRIMEAVRSLNRALEQYQMAAELVNEVKSQAQLQLRIARCLRALNRPMESRHALVLAHALDPENLTIRLELDRFF